MPDQTEQVSTAPAVKAAATDETQKQIIVDDTYNGNPATVTEDASESSEESSTSEETSDEPSEAVAAAVEAVVAEEKKEDLDEVEQFLQKDDRKDNVQKRIDQLTAQIKQLKDENTKLRVTEPKQNAEPEYTDAQLKSAMKKAFDDGDAELAFEIMDYKAKRAEKNILKMYEEEKSRVVNQAQQVHQEWNRVVNDYSRSWDAGDGSEIYQGAKDELNVGNENSLLYKLAMKFYTESVDDNGNSIYRVPGGQRLAVADAMAAIIKKRKLAPNELKTKQLERSLAKAKRKATAPTSSSSESALPKQRSTGNTLNDYMSERRKFLNERKF